MDRWRRAVVLFSIASLTLALSLLQVQRLGTHGWLVIPITAAAATAIGILYPYIISENGDAPDGSKVMRCVAVFVGIYQASIKIDFASHLELAVTLTALSVGIWWLFDRSRAGFIVSLTFTVLSATVAHFLLHFTILRPVDTGFLYSRLWCISFSGCVTFGTIGRRLAAGD